MGLPKYIVNLDELAKLLNDGVEIRATVNTGGLNNLLIDYFDRLLVYLRQLLSRGSYTQHSCGLHSYIPALNFDYVLTRIFDEDILITGITYAQTGWKVMDCWSLYAGGKLLFDSLFTKELAEHKHFNVFYPVKAGTEIKIIHHNTSGNSKQVWYDIDYLAQEPPVRDWIITIEWENGQDIDCCWADASNNHVLMGYRTEQLGGAPDRIYKDHDETGRNGMETWSLEGSYADRLLWGFGWHGASGPHNVKITVTLYDGTRNVIDEITDITGNMLGINFDKKGEFLCVYEFDLTNPVYSDQWTRINRMISS